MSVRCDAALRGLSTGLRGISGRDWAGRISDMISILSIRGFGWPMPVNPYCVSEVQKVSLSYWTQGGQSMIKIWLMLSFLYCSAAWGNDASCYSIQHPDRKNVCLAMSKKQNAYCYAVKDADTKNMCLANVMHQQSYCYAIRENDMKQQCLSQVKSS